MTEACANRHLISLADFGAPVDILNTMRSPGNPGTNRSSRPSAIWDTPENTFTESFSAVDPIRTLRASRAPSRAANVAEYGPGRSAGINMVRDCLFVDPLAMTEIRKPEPSLARAVVSLLLASKRKLFWLYRPGPMYLLSRMVEKIYRCSQYVRLDPSLASFDTIGA